MKLSAALLSAFIGFNNAEIDCNNGAAGTQPLFIASCNKDGFNIYLDETCRAAQFSGINFGDSFMWGVQTVTTMATPAGSAGTDVDGTFSGTCAKVKPTAADADGTTGDEWQWLIPLGNCGTSPTIDGTTGETLYKIYWNSQTTGSVHTVAQMGQVEFTCRLKAFQEDSANVEITEDTDLNADKDFNVDLASFLELKINTVDPASATRTSPFDSAETDVVLSSKTGDTEAKALTYAASTGPVSVGDHMELRLSATTGNEAIFDNYAISLNKCWATKDAGNDGTNDNPAGTNAEPNFPATNTDSVLLWDEFCPVQTWVGPAAYETTPAVTTPVVTYLNEKWDRTKSIHAIHFRQFAYTTTVFTSGSEADHKIFYHCIVKACAGTDDNTCSTKQLDGTLNTCTQPTSLAPARKRRNAGNDTANNAQAVQVNAETSTNSINADDCARWVPGHEGKICAEARKASSSAQTCAATTGLAILTYLNL